MKDAEVMSQEYLAGQLRLVNSKISRDDIKVIELAKRDIFDIEIIWLARIFDVPIEYLLGISDDFTTGFDGCDPFEDRSLRTRMNVCGIWLKKAREKSGNVTQSKLCDRMKELGFRSASHSAISNIERGARRVKLIEIKAFAEILETPVIYFFKGDRDKLPNIESFEMYVAQDD